MRILVLAPATCSPRNTGARIRNFYLARELSKRAEVVFLSFSQSDGDEARGGAGVTDEPKAPFEIADSPRRNGSYRAVDILRGIVGRTPFSVLNWTRATMAESLGRLLRERSFDAIQVEAIQLAGYLPILRAAQSGPALIFDWHNVDSEVMRRYARHCPGLLRRGYAHVTARRLERFERRTIPRFDAHITVSTRDRRRLEAECLGVPVFEVPNGVDVDYYATGRAESINGLADRGRHRIVFVGSMDYSANIDAVCHFAEDVWPIVYRRVPDLRFTIVGRCPAPRVQALASRPGIEVTGDVPDVRPYLREALASVVPLRIAGGTRMKILEAMAARVPVVSTPIGAEGLNLRDGTHAILAASDQEFAKALISLRAEDALWQRLVDAGDTLVRQRYTWSNLGADLWQVHSRAQEERRRRLRDRDATPRLFMV
jgi:sugar transferase (PEP-CTERM/EpsH1 system associated)